MVRIKGIIKANWMNIVKNWSGFGKRKFFTKSFSQSNRDNN